MRALAFLTVLAVGCGSGAATTATTPAPEAAPLAWLDGDWAYADGSGTEHWVELDGTRYGVGFIGDQFDLMVIDVIDGRARLTAMPAGAPGVEFTAEPSEPGVRAVTFANPAHDFPRTITYERTADDRLVARLGPDGPVFEMLAIRGDATTSTWTRTSASGRTIVMVGRNPTGTYARVWSGQKSVFEVMR